MKYFIICAMLFGGSAYAGDVIAPPITKYVDSPQSSKRPTNFGKNDEKKVEQKIAETVSHKR